MIKKILLIIFMVLMLGTVQAVEMCEDVVVPDVLCRLVTPYISCTTYSYEVTNTITNTTVDSGNMTQLYDGIYYVNFTQSQGNYLVKLCDDTTREIISGGDEEMGWLGIMLGLIAMTAFIGVVSFKIESEALFPIKRALFVMFVVNGLMLGIVPLIIALNPFNIASFQDLGYGYAFVNIALILGFLYNYYLAGFGGMYKRATKQMKMAKSKDFREERKVI